MGNIDKIRKKYLLFKIIKKFKEQKYMLEEYSQRIEKAKQKPYLALNMFQIGDIVYPFFSHNLVNWGTVVDINPITRKVTVNFNGVNRQFDPQWIIKTNPQIKVASKSKVIKAYHKMVEALYYKESPSIYKMSQDEKEQGTMTCPFCHEQMQIKFSAQDRTVQLICNECGKTINRNKIASLKKVASYVNDLQISFQQFAQNLKELKQIKKSEIINEYIKQNPNYSKLMKQFGKDFLEDLIVQLKKQGIKII